MSHLLRRTIARPRSVVTSGKRNSVHHRALNPSLYDPVRNRTERHPATAGKIKAALKSTTARVVEQCQKARRIVSRFDN